jgi:ankyrin repeat protein
MRKICGEAVDLGIELREAAGQGDVKKMLSCITKAESALKKEVFVGMIWEQPDAEGMRPLHWAAKEGHDQAVVLLAQMQADMNAPAGNGENIAFAWGAAPTALEGEMALIALNSEMQALAESKSKEEITRLVTLVVAASRPHLPTSARGGTPLHFAAECGHVATVSALVKAAADVHAHDAEGRTPLHWAAEAGHVEAINVLVQLGSDKDAKCAVGATALHLAAVNGHASTMRVLMQLGADKEAKCTRLKTLPSAVVHSLASTRRHYSDGGTPLHMAAINGRLEAMRVLLQMGVDKEAKCKKGRTAMHWAAANGQVEAMRVLAQLGADKEAGDGFGGARPLHMAANNASDGQVEAIKALIQLGADKDAKDDRGQRPLHAAAFQGYVEAILVLAQLGADKEAKDKDGRTPLAIAADNGKVESIKTLVQLGVDKQTKGPHGKSPLHNAAFAGHVAAAKVLVQLGADKEARCAYGGTPLHWAAGQGSPGEPLAACEARVEVIKALVELGAKLDSKGPNGDTALQLSIQMGQHQATQVLRELARTARARKEAATSERAHAVHTQSKASVPTAEEVRAMSVKELKAHLTRLHTDHSKCVEKSELVALLCAVSLAAAGQPPVARACGASSSSTAGGVEETVQVAVLTVEEAHAMTVRQLETQLAAAGVDYSAALEKSELVEMLLSQVSLN